MHKQTLKFILLSAILLTGCLADLYTKQIAAEHLKFRHPMTVISGILDFQYTENHGMIFGTFRAADSPAKQYGIMALTLIAIIVLLNVVRRLREQPFFILLPFFLILSGAAGNLVSRIITGRVVDFIHLYFKNALDWPFLFNCADVFIIAGEALLLILFFTKREVFRSLLSKNIEE